MTVLHCVGHTALPASTWTLVVDGDQVGTTRVESMWFCNLDVAADIDIAVAFLRAGQSLVAGSPPTKSIIFFSEQVNRNTTEIKGAAFGLLPGDRIYAWANAALITVTVFGK